MRGLAGGWRLTTANAALTVGGVCCAGGSAGAAGLLLQKPMGREDMTDTAARTTRMDPRYWPALRAKLIDDPSLVTGDAELLAALNVRPAAANLVEFGPAALARLEHARAAEADARAGITALAEANFAAQAQTHAAIVDLLEARHNADLAARVDEAARARFGLVAGALAVEGVAPAGWRPLPPGFTSHLLGAAGHRFGGAVASEPLFGAVAGEVRSSALVRLALWGEARPGLLTFGSPDPAGFTADMGGELVAFLARVVERTAERWAPVHP